MSGFDIKAGFKNVMKKLLNNEEFLDRVIAMLLGKSDAGKEAKEMMKAESMNETLEEAVAIHRMTKKALNEETETDTENDFSLRGMRKTVAKLMKKSFKFQRKVAFRALKNPKVLMAFIRLVASEGTDMAALEIVLKAYAEAAIEIASEGEDIQAALAEGVELNDKSANIMVGRFQPFTLGHLKCLEAIKANLGVPTLLCVIPGNGDERHPFTQNIQEEMFDRLTGAYPELFADVKYVKNAFVEAWVLAAKDAGVEPVSLTCGTDRKDSYENMVAKHGEKYGLSPEFKVYCLDRADDNISATSVRECLENDDYEGFCKQMPDCLHEMYDTLRKALVGEEEPAYQSSGLMEHFEYRDYRKKLDEAITKLVKKD